MCVYMGDSRIQTSVYIDNIVRHYLEHIKNTYYFDLSVLFSVR